MTSRGNRRFLTGSAAVLALTLGLTGCGGEKKEKAEPTVKPTVTAGVTLTPSGTKLDFGEAATMAWSPDQKAKGIVSVAVEKIVEGSAKDVARIKITPTPEHPRLYYVTVKVRNLGSADLGRVSAAGLPLYLAEGAEMFNPPAALQPDMRFEKCPRAVLPKKFAKGAEATVCLVYVPSSAVKQMVLQPTAGDMITWTGDVTTPSPSPSPTKKAKKATAKPSPSSTKG
jgi:hypothetical protein